MRVGKNYHLSYCTNTHAGESWETMFNHLKTYLPQVKQNVSPNAPFGFGLWLSNKASIQIEEANNLQVFKNWLLANDLYVFTMNGFPYGEFHDQIVKEKVHLPDWTNIKRLAYTLRLFNQLAFLLPEGVTGGISTSPLSYKHWHKNTQEIEGCFTKSAQQLIKVVAHLHDIEQRTGICMHLDIEPEPDGLLENSDEFVAFFEHYLIPIGVKELTKKLSKTALEIKEIILKHITICYDVCHFALAYEAPQTTFKKLESAKINVGKIQISAALKAVFTSTNTIEIWNNLHQFNETTYLHQATVLKEGKVITYSDLPELFNTDEKLTEVRIHFHVPIFLKKYAFLEATQDQIIEVFNFLKTKSITQHLEIETYTWNVLPETIQQDLTTSISQEIQWCMLHLK